MQISSRIDLQLTGQCNNSALLVSSIKRVDQNDRIANFNDESLTFDLSLVHGKTRQQGRSSANISDMNSSMQTDLAMQKDLVVCLLKLFAVREKDQKLIGVVSFEIDWQLEKLLIFDNKILPFQKCIDP